ncbi:MAG TPA: hypothetical protein EYP65_01610 [Armatimonadetes bacterium]|nr:hypothetical protein [Armatimonadota bacterium]
MTALLMAYDVDGDVRGFDPSEVEKIAEIHKEHGAPATFFILGRLLEAPEIAGRLKRALSGELFEVASHTYSHILLKDHPVHGQAPSLDKIEFEVKRACELIADVFGRDCLGLRSPCGFHRGLRGAPGVLRILWRNGIRYLSSDLRGPGDLLPSPVEKTPFWYDEEGFPDLLELPGHSWHDNVLKGITPHPILWPPPPGNFYPQRPPRTPEEEFEVYKHELEYALDKGLPYYSPVLHPWSIGKVDKSMRLVDLLLSHAKGLGIPIMNFSMMADRLRAEKSCSL